MASIAKTDKDGSPKTYIQVTHIEKTKAAVYLKQNPGSEWEIQQQLVRKLESVEIINVYEIKLTHECKFHPKA